MLVKPNIKNTELFNEHITCIKKASMYRFKFGPFNRPIFKLVDCVVKYPLGTFNKITVEHNNSDLIKIINNKLESALGTDGDKYSKLKLNELSIKINDKDKESVLKYTKFESVDVLVEFNNCWEMNNKIYVSFVLKDIKPSEQVEDSDKENEEFHFKDIIEE